MSIVVEKHKNFEYIVRLPWNDMTVYTDDEVKLLGMCEKMAARSNDTKRRHVEEYAQRLKFKISIEIVDDAGPSATGCTGRIDVIPFALMRRYAHRDRDVVRTDLYNAAFDALSDVKLKHP